MKLQKKLTFILMTLCLTFWITGCSEIIEDSNEDLLTGTFNTESEENTPTESKPKDIKLTELKATHELIINEQTIPVKTLYSLAETRAKNWLFTSPSLITISVKPDTVPEQYELMVTSVYADISMASKDAKYNGIRQDSMNIDYSALPTGGITMTPLNAYEMPFAIESVDKNQNFYYSYYGYGYGGDSRITESQLAKHANGAILNIIWTITLKDKQTGSIYMQTIIDSIKIPYVRNVN